MNIHFDSRHEEIVEEKARGDLTEYLTRHASNCTGLNQTPLPIVQTAMESQRPRERSLASYKIFLKKEKSKGNSRRNDCTRKPGLENTSM